MVPLFFLIFYSLVPKIEICLKYFVKKNPKKHHIVLDSQKDVDFAKTIYPAKHFFSKLPVTWVSWFIWHEDLITYIHFLSKYIMFYVCW